jgi:hypothetical protein
MSLRPAKAVPPRRTGGGLCTLLVALGALVVGCAGFFDGLAETEEKADLRSTRPIVRERFHLEYPGNWTIDDQDEDYDPDHLFSIDSPGSCSVTVIVFDAAISARTSVEAQVEALVPRVVKQPVQTPFARWGAYDGEGVALAGKIFGVMKGSIRIFAHESVREDLTLTVVEFCYDEDLPLVRPGFQLIERTFALGRQPQ